MDTPRYEISKSKLIENYQSIKEKILDGNMFYALKANGETSVLEILRDCGSNFECASVGEYDRLREIGIPNEKIICGLPIKPEEVLTHIYEGGCRYFVFDDIRELDKMKRLASDAKKVLRMYIYDLAPNCIEFGMKMEDIIHNDETVNMLSYIDGVSFHITNNTDINNQLKALDRVEEILKRVCWEKETPFILNLGGSYSLNGTDKYFEVLNERLRELKAKYNLVIYAEPGTAIVGSATRFFTKVIMSRKNGDIYDVYIDGGMPSGIVLEPKKVRFVGDKDKNTSKKIYRFLDTTCLHRTLFVKKFKETIEDGDMLEFVDFGAYSLCFRSDFHLWDKPIVRLVDTFE